MAFAPTALKFSRWTPRARSNTRREINPYTFAQTTYDFLGEVWEIDAECAPLQGRAAAEVQAWLADLGGTRDAFQVVWPGYKGPHGTLSANPTLAAAAAARARTVVATVAAGQALVTGDLVTIGNHIHRVTDAPAPVAGAQTLKLWPRLRAAAAAGATVHAIAPWGTFALADDVAPDVDLDATQIRLTLREAF
jgi:hypothetical protein